ncbi:MAG: hypothetical protein ACK53Y_05055, partial [bacterium]
MYCNLPVLQHAQAFTYQKIETAIRKLYDFASIREFNTPMDEATRTSSLQESLEDTVKKLELEERPILRQSKLLLESRATNRCI